VAGPPIAALEAIQTSSNSTRNGKDPTTTTIKWTNNAQREKTRQAGPMTRDCRQWFPPPQPIPIEAKKRKKQRSARGFAAAGFHQDLEETMDCTHGAITAMTPHAVPGIHRPKKPSTTLANHRMDQAKTSKGTDARTLLPKRGTRLFEESSPFLELVFEESKRNSCSNSIHQTTAATGMDFLKDYNIDKVRNLAEDT
jgi:hypothetical protein